MKKQILYYSFAIIFIIGVYAGATHVAAQDGQIAGGYGDASITDKDVKSAAAYAIRTRVSRTHKKLTLVKIQKAEMQVVAGLNYRICMRVKDSRGRRSTVTAVVYKNLQNRKSLSRWKTGGCTYDDNISESPASFWRLFAPGPKHEADCHSIVWQSAF